MNAAKTIAKYAVLITVVAFFSMISGCAISPNAHPDDPWEPYNRSMTEFNDGIDAAVAKPIATVYQKIVPIVIQTGVHNFFSNLYDPWNAVNNLLQLKPQQAVESTFRFAINTVLGFGGIFDIASEMRIEKNWADFGSTLGHYGVKPGPYIVLPFLGPSTLRDTVAAALTSRSDLIWHFDTVAQRNALYGLRLIDKRTTVLRNTNVLEAVAIDKYTFTRDIFLQIRRNDVYDGNPPDDKADINYDNVEIPPGRTEEKPEPRYDLEPSPAEPTQMKLVEQVPQKPLEIKTN